MLQLESSSLIKKHSCIVDGGPLLQVAEDLSILLFIPFLDKLLYPLLGGYTPNMKNRIWIGSVLCVLAAAALIAMMYSAGLQSGFLSVIMKNHDDFPYHWYIPAVAIVSTVVLGLSEVLIEVGGMYTHTRTHQHTHTNTCIERATCLSAKRTSKYSDVMSCSFSFNSS